MKGLAKQSIGAALVACIGVTMAGADVKVTTAVSVTNPPTAGGLVALVGSYTTVYHKGQAKTALPDGTYRVFDFDKKQVWTIDPVKKTFYQLSLDNFLKLSSVLPSTLSSRRFETSLGSTFKAADGQASKQVGPWTVAPYDAIALGNVEPASQAQRSGGGGGYGRRRGGGGVFGGGGGGSNTPPSDPGAGSNPTNANDFRVKSFGQLWMSKLTNSDVSTANLAIPQVVLMLPYAPGLRNLVDEVRKSNMLPIEGDFTVEHGLVTASNPAPVVTSIITSIDPTVSNPDDFLIPSGYLKVDAPTSLWPSA